MSTITTKDPKKPKKASGEFENMKELIQYKYGDLNQKLKVALKNHPHFRQPE